MRGITHRTADSHSGNQGGFSLIIVLLFLGVIAGIIAFNMRSQMGAREIDQARAAGWHLAQVSQAARIFVRDRSQTGGIYNKQNLIVANLPRPAITINDLILAGLLPANFPTINSLGQTPQIRVANYPVTASPALNTTVANAYVYLPQTADTQVRPGLMQYVIEGAKQAGLFAGAPVFNTGGVNVSTDCDNDGQRDVVLWDTGCLDVAEFRLVTGQANFTPGSLMVPAWKSFAHDSRAVMRFAQPENPGFATMLTSLEMATPITDAAGECTQFVQIYDYNNPVKTAMRNSTICDVQDDTGNTILDDRRFNLVNVRNATARSVIAANQGGAEVSRRYNAVTNLAELENENQFISNNNAANGAFISASNDNEVVYVGRNMTTTGNVWATARQANPTPTNARVVFETTTGVRTGLGVDHNILIDNADPAIALNMDVRGTASVGNSFVSGAVNGIVADATVINGRIGAATISTSNGLNVPTTCSGMACGVVSDNVVLSGGGAAGRIETSKAVVNTLSTDTLSVQGPSGSSSMRPGNIPRLVGNTVTGSTSLRTDALTVGGALAVDGATSIGRLNSTTYTTSITNCLTQSDACPNVTKRPGNPTPN